MAGLGFLKQSASDVIGDIGSTLLSEAIGGMEGVLYRQAPTAGRLLGVGNEVYTFHNASAPRPGFMYMVEFITPLNGSTTRTGFDPSSTLSTKTGFNFQAKSVSRPSIQLQSDVVNQYNKKRVVYTGRTHTPVTMTFHDDIAGKLQQFWKSYFAHYFEDGVTDSSGSLFWDLVSDTFTNPAGTEGVGLRTIPGTNEKYYFDKIIIYQFFGGYYTTITLFNPVISNFQYANDLAYDNTAGTSPEVTITFEYENFAYNTDPQRVSASNASKFGFQYDYNNPPLGLSQQKIQGYLDSFLRKYSIVDTVSSLVGGPLGLGQTTTGRIADRLLRGVITEGRANTTSRTTKGKIINFGVNAFSDIINGQVKLGTKSSTSTSGSFPLETQYSDNGNSEFSQQMETIANKLLRTGLYSQTSTTATEVNSTNFKTNSLIITNPNGEFQFTEKGLAGVNSLISQSSVFGVANSSISGNTNSLFSTIQSSTALKGLYG